MPQREDERTGRRITIRLRPELYAKIVDLAKRDRRAVAEWVKLAIEDFVEAQAPAAKKR